MAITGGLTPSHEEVSSYLLGSSFLSSRPRRHTSLDSTKRPDQRPYRPRSASNLLDSTDDFDRRLYDPVLAPHLQRRGGGKDGVTDLVEFLKNHAPPPDNFMSIPEDGLDDERGRWLRWARLMAGRNKTAPRGPPQIRLPDTAVSGTTTGGHRHIAITIPLEAFPMGERPRSQYPVYSEAELRNKASPVRTYVNEKGVVTVLKTVNEDREASTSSTHYSTHSNTQNGTFPRSSSRGGRASVQGYSSAPSSRGSSTLRPGESTPRTATMTSSGFPARVSSMANRSLHQHISIDGLLSQPGSAGMAPPKSKSMREKRLEGMPGSDQWPLKEKKSVKVKPSPIAINGTPTEGNENISHESGATILMDNPLGPRHDDSEPATPASTMSRKDKVRERRKRDMEALRNNKKGQPSLSPILVVVNVEPCEEAAAPLTPPRTEPSPGPDSDENSQKRQQKPSLAVKAAAEPSPPLSPRVSPSPRHSQMDRTALARRREWKVTREQERKSKESRAAVHQRAKELAAGLSEDLDDGPQTLDKEILRLYEAYREHRFRDMERRVRRLERNGDVWLRALVPVLDNLNHTMASSSQEGLNDRAYLSEGEPAAASRQIEKRTAVPMRRANSTRPAKGGRPATGSRPATREAEIAEREVILESSDEESSGSVSSDEMTGLDTIEPLMRELAGAAKQRQNRSAGHLRAT